MTQQGEFGRNLVETFGRAVRARGDGPFLWAKREGAYRPLAWRAADGQVRLLARCLADLGVAPGDRVAVVGENRPEWCLADLAILTAGGVTVPAYTTNTPDDHAYILRHSDAVGVVVSGKGGPPDAPPPGPADAPASLRDLDGRPAGTASAGRRDQPRLGRRLARGEGAPDPGDRAGALGPDDLACFIYTSAPAAGPKAVMLSHGNILANVGGRARLLERSGSATEVLPLVPAAEPRLRAHGRPVPPIGLRGQIYYAEGVETLSPTSPRCGPRSCPACRACSRCCGSGSRRAWRARAASRRGCSTWRSTWESPLPQRRPAPAAPGPWPTWRSTAWSGRRCSSGSAAG
jgi:long-chain acyl-CoA synthetase